MSKANTELVSKYVVDFLERQGGKELVDQWREKETQTGLKKTVGGLKVGGKNKKEKDPSRPKRGKSDYLFFCMDERPKIAAANPEMSAKDITSELGKRWTALKASKNTKALKKFADLAASDKARYESEMKVYNAGAAETVEAVVEEVVEESAPAEQKAPSKKKGGKKDKAPKAEKEAEKEAPPAKKRGGKRK